MAPLIIHFNATPAKGLPAVDLWRPFAAVLIAVAILIAGQTLPLVLLGLLAGDAGSGQVAAPDQPQAPDLLLALLAGQASLGALTWAAASWRARPAALLGLDRPVDGAAAYIRVAAVMLPILAIVNCASYLISPEGFAADFRQFADLVQGPSPWLALLAIGVGAPLWEEMLFRGFLLPPLAAGLGFWPAAAIVSAGWTALHFTYSAAGLMEVFVIGLFFAWAFRWVGSLWVPIACHAAYNTILFAVLWMMG